MTLAFKSALGKRERGEKKRKRKKIKKKKKKKKKKKEKKEEERSYLKESVCISHFGQVMFTKQERITNGQ